MPRIASFDGIVITMYFGDHNPPHFHASYQGAEALVGIDPLVVLEGGLPGRKLARVLEWARSNQAMLLAKWDELQG